MSFFKNNRIVPVKSTLDSYQKSVSQSLQNIEKIRGNRKYCCYGIYVSLVVLSISLALLSALAISMSTLYIETSILADVSDYLLEGYSRHTTNQLSSMNMHLKGMVYNPLYYGVGGNSSLNGSNMEELLRVGFIMVKRSKRMDGVRLSIAEKNGIFVTGEYFKWNSSNTGIIMICNDTERIFSFMVGKNWEVEENGTLWIQDFTFRDGNKNWYDSVLNGSHGMSQIGVLDNILDIKKNTTVRNESEYFFFSRRIEEPNGEFRGVATAYLPFSYGMNFLGNWTMNHGSVIVQKHRENGDGKILSTNLYSDLLNSELINTTQRQADYYWEHYFGRFCSFDSSRNKNGICKSDLFFSFLKILSLKYIDVDGMKIDIITLQDRISYQYIIVESLMLFLAVTIIGFFTFLHLWFMYSQLFYPLKETVKLFKMFHDPEMRKQLEYAYTSVTVVIELREIIMKNYDVSRKILDFVNFYPNPSEIESIKKEEEFMRDGWGKDEEENEMVSLMEKSISDNSSSKKSSNDYEESEDFSSDNEQEETIEITEETTEERRRKRKSKQDSRNGVDALIHRFSTSKGFGKKKKEEEQHLLGFHIKKKRCVKKLSGFIVHYYFKNFDLLMTIENDVYGQYYDNVLKKIDGIMLHKRNTFVSFDGRSFQFVYRSSKIALNDCKNLLKSLEKKNYKSHNTGIASGLVVIFDFCDHSMYGRLGGNIHKFKFCVGSSESKFVESTRLLDEFEPGKMYCTQEFCDKSPQGDILFKPVDIIHAQRKTFAIYEYLGHVNTLKTERLPLPDSESKLLDTVYKKYDAMSQGMMDLVHGETDDALKMFRRCQKSPYKSELFPNLNDGENTEKLIKFAEMLKEKDFKIDMFFGIKLENPMSLISNFEYFDLDSIKKSHKELMTKRAQKSEKKKRKRFRYK